ncbi:MAG TPA: 2-oxoacid:acceptor oxidoreductase family protein [Bryobacteraceae bacterium]|nr:2-oxoacid:acceptor oxidoreductase family protein [Bryobacteraceae bacterium]HPT26414.1 2-oxoacid:acceptor oxidoreductase family protein [Bryobacteraceae bacterium]
MAEYNILHEKAHCFYPEYERKGELHHQTHYCPGCGHGIAHKLIAQAIDQLGIQDRVITISPVGCGVFAYYYLDTGNIQAAHGRASAVATAAKRCRPGAIVISYQGDGDLAAIGTAEIVHSANRGENISVFFINNGIYGMTGGQMAPTTPVGTKSTTTPFGRDAASEGYPIKVCEMLATLEAPVYLERVGLGNTKQIMAASRAVKKALTNQVQGLGFSLVEILSPCPTIWKLTPVNAAARVCDEMAKIFPVGVYKDRTKEATPRHAARPTPPLEEFPSILGIEAEDTSIQVQKPAAPVDWRIRVAGFGGQGVLMLGEVLAEAGLDAGLEVSWLPSYGPEMRSGTSNCHVRISTHPIASPLVNKPNVLLALNEPSLKKFIDSVEPGGWVLYNGDALPEGAEVREGVNIQAIPFTQLADNLGEARAGNIVTLGALLELTGMLKQEAVDNALALLIKSTRWLEIDRQALKVGRQAAHQNAPANVEVCR